MNRYTVTMKKGVYVTVYADYSSIWRSGYDDDYIEFLNLYRKDGKYGDEIVFLANMDDVKSVKFTNYKY